MKFSESIKKIVEHFNSENALDYGSGGTNLNTTILKENIKFIDYIGLKKFILMSLLEKKGKPKNVIWFYALMFLNIFLLMIFHGF